MSSQVSYEMVKGGVMVLSAETEALLDSGDERIGRQVRAEILRDAGVIATKLGHSVEVRYSDRRTAYEVVSA